MDAAALGIVVLATIVVAVALDSVVPIVPSELLVVSTSAATVDGTSSLLTVGGAAALGALAGDVVVYGAARRLGHRPVTCGRSPLGRAVAGGVSPAMVVGGRFVPLGRTLVATACGAGGMPLRRFVAPAATGSVLWAAWTVGLGCLGGAVATQPLAAPAIGVGVGAMVGLLVARLTRRRTERRTIARAWEAPNDTGFRLARCTDRP